MRSGEVWAAVTERTGSGLLKRGGAIRRQSVQRNIPTIVIQPFLDVTATARDFDAVVLVLQEHDMVGKLAEAAQHHVVWASRRA